MDGTKRDIKQVQKEIKEITNEIKKKLEKEYNKEFANDKNGNFAEVFIDICVNEYKKNATYNKLQKELKDISLEQKFDIDKIMRELFS